MGEKSGTSGHSLWFLCPWLSGEEEVGLQLLGGTCPLQVWFVCGGGLMKQGFPRLEDNCHEFTLTPAP